MDCQSARESLGPYLDDELPSSTRTVVSAHLADCPECAAELASLRSISGDLASRTHVVVPEGLWSEIERKLDCSTERPMAHLGRFSGARRFAIAAGILLAVGAGTGWLFWSENGAATAKASTVDFSALLDSISIDATAAFEKFLGQYHARSASSAEAKRTASHLDFEIPETLPGGFRLVKAYTLRFGDETGAAASYDRNGEFLGVIFHRPVQREHFGTHKDYDCVIGQHRGHAVAVGEWKLVHVTDSTTCHCVLSKLSEDGDLPPVLKAVAPRSVSGPATGSHGHSP